MPTKHPCGAQAQGADYARGGALFKRALVIEADGDDEFWEQDGGARHEYLDVRRDLNRLLAVKIWEPSPLDAAAEMDFSSDDGTPWVQGWRRASRLRAALEKALGL